MELSDKTREALNELKKGIRGLKKSAELSEENYKTLRRVLEVLDDNYARMLDFYYRAKLGSYATLFLVEKVKKQYEK